ncbi:cysteine desulfurase family protein [Alicyclobacillus sp. SO9]|uniref:cysteine desulfurase family protein n=1 Tax=Alicyclobacillus sp. SO9 TaxID=2665646 RepID=UPI0018E728C6|nr:cysteine desulfurase family protein [Alicyclobacillus sp. SO9]QQE80690.1 cysteine desulfurase [Alicyclobacillus sp. SO9]
MERMNMELYFDNAATTPLLSDVKKVLQEQMDNYGNPSSLHHLGVKAEQVLTQTRKDVLRCAGRKNDDVIFTGSGTEANNLAIFGVAQLRDRPGHAVTTALEHPSVLEAFKRLERLGWKISYVKPDDNGVITSAQILREVQDDTALVSVMHVNNETGDIFPVSEISAALKAYPKVRFHVDGIQAFGKIPNAAEVSGADLYSLSGHKIGAPKGIGALIVRRGVQLQPLLYGGGQERGLRSGTENVLGIAALGTASKLAARDMSESYPHVSTLMRQLREGLKNIPGCVVDERPLNFSPYIVSTSFPGLKGEVLVHTLEEEGLYVSTGSACSTQGGHAKASHVLEALGRETREITGTLRFSLARWQSEEDVNKALEIVKSRAAWLADIMK